jgi:nitrogen-specific signal transduction histidine kinase
MDAENAAGKGHPGVAAARQPAESRILPRLHNRSTRAVHPRRWKGGCSHEQQPGSGIAPEELPRLFERFQKGSDSRGSGRGLPIARELVLAHGGDIGIESAPGKGTEVTVSLPR